MIEFLNIPIGLVKFVMDNAMLLFDHMNSVCEYLDGYVQLAKVDATFENTRWALQELACRPLESGLQRGHGCDGLDNTCDDDKQIDECDEDIIPPDFDLRAGPEECTARRFQSEAEAVSCIEGLVSATDDCKPVSLDFSIAQGTQGSCTPVVTATAIALGCGNRPEDISQLDFSVMVDGDAPEVSCEIGNQNMNGKGRGDLEDADFSFTVSDACSDSLSVKIEVFSNEVDSKGADDMALISAGDDPSIYLRNDYCSGNENNCQISTPGNNSKSREYAVSVTAVDSAGNQASAVCTTYVGSTAAAGNDLFGIASKEITVELNDVSDFILNR